MDDCGSDDDDAVGTDSRILLCRVQVSRGRQMGEGRGTYQDRCEGTGRERADHYNVLSVRAGGQDRTGCKAERQAPAGLRAYSMLNLMAGGLMRHEAFWASPSEGEEK